MARPPRRRALRRTKGTRKSAALVPKSTYFFPFVFSFIALFTILVAIGGYYLHYKQTLLSFEVQLSPIEEVSPTGRPIHLKIPSAQIDSSIKAVTISKGAWPTYEDAVSYVVGSGQPTEQRPIILYSQAIPGLLKNLDQVKVGDLITLTTADQRTFEYLVQDSFVVSSTENQLFLNSKTDSLIVFTSSGFLNTKRLVIKASPIRVPTF